MAWQMTENSLGIKLLVTKLASSQKTLGGSHSFRLSQWWQSVSKEARDFLAPDTRRGGDTVMVPFGKRHVFHRLDYGSIGRQSLKTLS